MNPENYEALLDAEAQPVQRRGLRVTFSNLEYILPSNVDRGKMAVVLKRMSGFLNAGEMTAVMGPSGCGKSILMDVLSGRRSVGTINGEIKFSSRVPTQAFLRKCTGYVEQFSSLLENLTVFEMLMYTAELKLSLSEPWKQKKQAVENLIEKLALVSCRDIKIGNPHLDRGISGGQGKRVNIGLGLITNPVVLFMDEPISGLDSYTANEIMELVKGLVSEGMTLCATLHSPTPFTFGLFDHILLLLQGEMVFFGTHSDVSQYFASIAVGHFHPNESVAEWLTGIIVKADRENESTARLIQAYKESELRQMTEEYVNEIEDTKEHDAVDNMMLAESEIKVNPFWFSLRILLIYRSLKNYRTSSFWITRMFDKSVVLLLLATMYQGLGDDFSLANSLNISSLFYVWATFSATGALVYVPKIVIERWVFYRENREGLYPVISYFLVKVMEECTVAALLSVVFSVILWNAVDLQGSLLRFILNFFALFCSSIFLAVFFGAVAPNMEVANALFPCYLITQIFYAGYLLLPKDIPSYLIWFSKIDFLKYSFAAYMVNQYRSGQEITREMIITPEEQLEQIGLGDVDADEYVKICYLFVVAFGILAYLAMHFVRYERKA